MALDLFGNPLDPEPRGRGRRPWLPQPQDVALAQQLVTEGATLEVIGRALGHSPKTVRRRLGAELEVNAGRRQWAPTVENRAEAERLAALGVRQDRIAEALGVSVPTLTKHLRAELAQGRAVHAARLAAEAPRRG